VRRKRGACCERVSVRGFENERAFKRGSAAPPAVCVLLLHWNWIGQGGWGGEQRTSSVGTGREHEGEEKEHQACTRGCQAAPSDPVRHCVRCVPSRPCLSPHFKTLFFCELNSSLSSPPTTAPAASTDPPRVCVTPALKYDQVQTHTCARRTPRDPSPTPQGVGEMPQTAENALLLAKQKVKVGRQINVSASLPKGRPLPAEPRRQARREWTRSLYNLEASPLRKCGAPSPSSRHLTDGPSSRSSSR
jgi:hypothetical protein